MARPSAVWWDRLSQKGQEKLLSPEDAEVQQEPLSLAVTLQPPAYGQRSSKAAPYLFVGQEAGFGMATVHEQMQLSGPRNQIGDISVSCSFSHQ